MIIHRLIQGTTDWHNIRRGIPTASQFDRIITPKTLELAAGRVTYIDELIAREYFSETMSEKFTGSYWKERGQEIEPLARDWLACYLGVTIDEVGFCESDCHRIGFSPDGVIGLNGHTFETGVEFKGEKPSTHVRYMREKAAGMPVEHRLQVEGSMVVSGAREWVFCSFAPGWQPVVHHVKWSGTTDIIRELLWQFLDELDNWREKLIPRLEIASDDNGDK